jgi:hypothetical protein
VGPDDVQRLFHEPRDRDYRQLAVRYRKALQKLEKKSDAARARVGDEIARLSRDHQRIRDIDFFDAPGGAEVRRVEEAIAMRTRRPESPRAQERPSLDLTKLRGRRWVTRPRPHIDRLASAWLIKRFIDTEAVFVFAPPAEFPSDAIPFDAPGVELSHQGEDCTFETLVKRTRLRDRRLVRLAELVHEADLRDGKYPTRKLAVSMWPFAHCWRRRRMTTRCWPRAWRCSRASTPPRRRRPEVTLIPSRRDVLDLLSLPDCIDAVERAFRLHAEGRSLGPGVLEVRAAAGGFHIKAAGLLGERSYFAAKTNANFPDNPRRFGRPTIQGTVMLADAGNGEPLAIMDSGSVTALRTGAATAVAAKFLARRDARTATIVGCGVQGEVQLAAIAAVLPLRHAWMLDTDHARAESVAARAGASLSLRVEAAKDLRTALGDSDVCVTCTCRIAPS